MSSSSTSPTTRDETSDAAKELLDGGRGGGQSQEDKKEGGCKRPHFWHKITLIQKLDGTMVDKAVATAIELGGAGQHYGDRMTALILLRALGRKWPEEWDHCLVRAAILLLTPATGNFC